MKYSLHEDNCSPAYLAKADEIVVPYKDRNIIADFAIKYPKAQFVLEIFPTTSWEVDEVEKLYILAQERLTICLPNLTSLEVQKLKAKDIPFFWGYTIETFWGLEAAIAAGASQARIGAPIFFDAEALKYYNIPKRVAANMAHEGYITQTDGVIGPWIRPEDVETYEGIIDIIEFKGCMGQQEEAFYRIYAEEHSWPGPINQIISNLNSNASNRLIPSEFAEYRKSCKQICTTGKSCRICYRMLDLANSERLRQYLKTQEKDNT